MCSFIENESYFEENKIKTQQNSPTIDKAEPILPQLYGLDTLEHREIENVNFEDEPILQEEDEVSQNNHEGEIEVRRSSRLPQPCTRLKDFITYKIQYPIQTYISYNNILSQHISFLISICKEQEPYTYLEAIKNLIWCKSMREELNALEKK
jgi:hypothetical protein